MTQLCSGSMSWTKDMSPPRKLSILEAGIVGVPSPHVDLLQAEGQQNCKATQSFLDNAEPLCHLFWHESKGPRKGAAPPMKASGVVARRGHEGEAKFRATSSAARKAKCGFKSEKLLSCCLCPLPPAHQRPKVGL